MSTIFESDDQPLDIEWQEKAGIKHGDLTVLVGRRRADIDRDTRAQRSVDIERHLRPGRELIFSLEQAPEDVARRFKPFMGRRAK